MQSCEPAWGDPVSHCHPPRELRAHPPACRSLLAHEVTQGGGTAPDPTIATAPGTEVRTRGCGVGGMLWRGYQTPKRGQWGRNPTWALSLSVGMPSAVTQGKRRSLTGVTWDSPPSLHWGWAGGTGAFWGATQPGAPTGSSNTHKPPHRFPPQCISTELTPRVPARGCGLGPWGAEPGGTGAGRCLGAWVCWSIGPVAPVLFHSVLFLSLRSAGHGQPDKGIGQRFRKLSSFFPGF